tara:strand:- start:31799 stop:32455 length:657 start_codon:yes stop_codon:yes gene_type:complete
MDCRKLKFIERLKMAIFISFVFFLSTSNGFGQQVEISGGLAQKVLFGQEKSVYRPSLGYELGFNHHVNDYRFAHSVSYGFNIGAYRLNRYNSEDGLADQHQQLFETKGSFRYDYFVKSNFSLFSGIEAGFQFINLKTDQNVVISSERTTQVFTKGVLAPKAGFNFEFNPYLSVYYKLSYDLGRYLGDHPTWGNPSSKWTHLLNNSAGIRIKFNNGYLY